MLIDEMVTPENAGFAASFLDPPERHADLHLTEGDAVEIL
jgi:hypothetical protein